MTVTYLADRALIRVTGPEAAPFLENLVTSTVEALKPGEARLSALLTPQGKILFDFILVRTPEGFLIDCHRSVRADLVKRLGFYRLRAKVTIALDEDRVVVSLPAAAPAAGLTFPDPRHPGLGRRAIVPADAVPDTGCNDTELAALRRRLGVPEGIRDYAYGDVFPADVNMDSLGGVDFRKGCFVGQEVVARMKHRGTARRRTVLAEADTPLPGKGASLTVADRPVGELMSGEGGTGLAMVRLDRVAEARGNAQPVLAGDVPVRLALPDYATFGWPETAGD